MSKFLNVPKRRQKELQAQFPDLLKLWACEETDKYHYLAISIFDHWLTNDECDDLLVNIGDSEQSRRNCLFDRFNELLITKTEILHITQRGSYRPYPKFREFISRQAAQQCLNHTSTQRYGVVLPEFGVVYFESYDDTNALYFRDMKHQSKFKDWAQQVGLNYIDPPTK